MKAGDLAAFPSGTGICHTFLNNGAREATLLVGGEANKPDNRIRLPAAPASVAGDMPWSHWWDDAPARARRGRTTASRTRFARKETPRSSTAWLTAARPS